MRGALPSASFVESATVTVWSVPHGHPAQRPTRIEPYLPHRRCRRCVPPCQSLLRKDSVSGHGHRFATSLSTLQPVALPLCLRDAVNTIRVGLVPPSLPATPASKGVGLLLDSEPSVASPHRGPDETMTMARSPIDDTWPSVWSLPGLRMPNQSVQWNRCQLDGRAGARGIIGRWSRTQHHRPRS